jgi:hypothetical protein
MKEPQDDGLYDEIQGQIFKILHKRQRYTLWKNVTRITLLILAALITLISGWDATSDDKMAVAISQFNLTEGHIILILSTLVTFITAMEALFRYSDKSTTYGVMLFDFRTLRRKMCYDFEKDPNLYAESKDNYFKEYQEILASQKDLIEESQS